jgi:uncharacterized metal-binding protein
MEKLRCEDCPEHEQLAWNDLVEIIIYCRKHGIGRAAGAFCIEVENENKVALATQRVKSK